MLRTTQQAAYRLSSHAPASGAAVANASAVTDASGGVCSDLLYGICTTLLDDAYESVHDNANIVLTVTCRMEHSFVCTLNRVVPQFRIELDEQILRALQAMLLQKAKENAKS